MQAFLAAQGLAAKRGTTQTELTAPPPPAQGLHRLHGLAPPQGLHGLQAFFAPQGLQGLQGLQAFLAAQGLQAASWTGAVPDLGTAMGLAAALRAGGAWRTSAELEPTPAAAMPTPAISGKTAPDSKDARMKISLRCPAAHPFF